MNTTMKGFQTEIIRSSNRYFEEVFYLDVRLGFPSECALRHTADRHLSWKASLVSGGQSLATTSIKYNSIKDNS